MWLKPATPRYIRVTARKRKCSVLEPHPWILAATAPLLLLTRNFMTVCWWCSSDLWDPTDSAQLSNVVFYSRAHPLCQTTSSTWARPSLFSHSTRSCPTISFHFTSFSLGKHIKHIDTRSPVEFRSQTQDNQCKSQTPVLSCGLCNHHAAAFQLTRSRTGLGRVLDCGAQRNLSWERFHKTSPLYDCQEYAAPSDALF